MPLPAGYWRSPTSVYPAARPLNGRSLAPRPLPVRTPGVRRVSIGTSLLRRAIGSALAASRELLEHGTFGWLDGLPTVAELGVLVDPRPEERPR